MARPTKAYKNLGFLNSPAARTIRMLCEYEEPRERFEKSGIQDTIVMFGSARLRSGEEAAEQLAAAEKALAQGGADAAALEDEVLRARKVVRSSVYYEAARELARRMTEWGFSGSNPRRYHVCSGGGPGIMEAANRGAGEVDGGESVGLGISLPFEEDLNQYVTPGLGFEFHYFFMRKYWFLYLAKALVVFPGGFGTLDEFFEVLTLRQTGKVTKNIPIVLFGAAFWNSVLNLESMVEWGTISPRDLDLFHVTDDVEDAYQYLVTALESEPQQETTP